MYIVMLSTLEGHVVNPNMPERVGPNGCTYPKMCPPLPAFTLQFGLDLKIP